MIRKKKYGHGATTNSSTTTLIPSRDGRTVTIQTIAYPIQHTDCGHYWLCTSQMNYITCAGCGNTITRKRHLTTFKGEPE
jgi:hypothetical protein